VTVSRHVLVLVDAVDVWVFPKWVPFVDRVVRVVPVDDRVIETDLQAFGTNCIHEFAHQVSLTRPRCTVIGEFCVPETEAFMVLRCQDDIFHARVPGEPRKGRSIEEVGVEVPGIPFVLGCLSFLDGHDPLVPCGHRVEPEMDKHPEAVVIEPSGCAWLPWGDRLSWHRGSPVRVSLRNP